MTLHVGVDVGGTFTDLVSLDSASGVVTVCKVPSTPADPSIGLIDGLKSFPAPISAIDLIVHGTTVATNAVLQRQGARCGLIMTRGFRDVIELRRRDRPDTYGLKGRFEPLVSRECRVEVAERTDFRGQVTESPDDAEVEAAARALLDQGVEVVIVGFMNAYANPANEQKARRVLERVWPNDHIVTASEVLPEIREFERISTAVLNGYVQPLVGNYLKSLVERLKSHGYGNDVLIIQSNGGVMSQSVARQFSVNTILSGPAAGVIAAQRIGAAVGESNLIACDVGGTSLDIAVIEDGQPATALEMSLEYGIPMRTTMLDIRTVGAGGGSIAWIDAAGILQIGPQSAGADPGPVCYGQGGTLPTVTDANLLLGRINVSNPIGREAGWRFDRERAAEAVTEVIGRPLGLGLDEAAWAILQVANHKIASSIRMLTVERGYDPRDFTLVAYGGAGPLHAGAVLRELEIARALIPPWPGITSALGCLIADARHDFVHTLNQRLDALDLDAMHAQFARHVEQGREMIEHERIEVDAVQVLVQADMAYDGQIHEVRTALPGPTASKAEMQQAFEAAYTTLYGDILAGRPIRVRTMRTAVIGVRHSGRLFPPRSAKGGSLREALLERRPVFSGDTFQECPVYERGLLPLDTRLEGPAVIEQDDTTTVLEPGLVLTVDGQGNLIIEEAS